MLQKIFTVDLWGICMDGATITELQRTLRRFGAATVSLLSILVLATAGNDAFFASELFGQILPWIFLLFSLTYPVLTAWGAFDRSGLSGE